MHKWFCTRCIWFQFWLQLHCYLTLDITHLPCFTGFLGLEKKILWFWFLYLTAMEPRVHTINVGLAGLLHHSNVLWSLEESGYRTTEFKYLYKSLLCGFDTGRLFIYCSSCLMNSSVQNKFQVNPLCKHSLLDKTKSTVFRLFRYAGISSLWYSYCVRFWPQCQDTFSSSKKPLAINMF